MKAYQCRYCGEIRTGRPRKLVLTGGALCTYCVSVLETQQAEIVEMTEEEMHSLPPVDYRLAARFGLAR